MIEAINKEILDRIIPKNSMIDLLIKSIMTRVQEINIEKRVAIETNLTREDQEVEKRETIVDHLKIIEEKEKVEAIEVVILEDKTTEVVLEEEVEVEIEEDLEVEEVVMEVAADLEDLLKMIFLKSIHLMKTKQN